jgi:transcription initiation factor TFIID TATA-box-binding protein
MDMSEAQDPKDTIEIENVVASTAIGQELDLEKVTLDMEGADYDPEQFPGLVYRTEEPRGRGQRAEDRLR